MPWPVFEKMLAHYRELEVQLGDPTVIGDRARYTKLAKEHGGLSKQVKPYLDFLKISAEIDEALTLQASEVDPEMARYLEEEVAAQRGQQAALRSRLEDLLLLDPSENFASVILEVRAGTGGDEAALFAGDLYNMYTHYARDKGWK